MPPAASPPAVSAPLPTNLPDLRARLADLATAIYGDGWRSVALVFDFPGPDAPADVFTVRNDRTPAE
jgi:hypothetical protein